MIDVVVDRPDAVLAAASEVAATPRGSSPSPLGGALDPWRVPLDGDDRAATSARRLPRDRRRTLARRLVLRSFLPDRLAPRWRPLPAPSSALPCSTLPTCPPPPASPPPPPPPAAFPPHCSPP